MKISYRSFGIISSVLALMLAGVMYWNTSKSGYSDIREHATDEARLVVELTSSFVEAYTQISANSDYPGLPNPAAFRADSLHRVDKGVLDAGLSTIVVGLPEKQITHAATDEQMRRELIEMERTSQTSVSASMIIRDSNKIHRTLWPFFATQQGCADCHNKLQGFSGSNAWQLNDLMGAQVVDQEISQQLSAMKFNALAFATLLFLATVALSYCFLFVYQQFHQGKELKTLATTDSLTGCINRREMYTRVSQMSSKVNGALLMLDLDKFKHINDTYGHSVGDAVILDFTARIKKALRNDDWIARVGGEEFVVWLHNVKPTAALLIAERLRKESENTLVVDGVANISYTVSIGLHVVNNSTPSLIDSWVQAADALLYRAKSEGRNRVAFQRELMV